MNVSEQVFVELVARIPQDLKVVLLLDETPFFHPQMEEELLLSLGPRVVRVLIVEKVPAGSDLKQYLLLNFSILRPVEILRLGLRWFLNRSTPIRSWFDGRRRSFPSVRRVALRAGVEFKSIRSRDELCREIRELEQENFDVLVSSNSLILPNEILTAPSLGCINRHSALLPSYGGLWPIFQAMRQGAKQTGVTVHDMTSVLDEGTVRCQIAIPINEGDSLFELYERTFRASAVAIVDAIGNLIEGIEFPENGELPSYYSMPSREQWKEFRTRGMNFV